ARLPHPEDHDLPVHEAGMAEILEEPPRVFLDGSVAKLRGPQARSSLLERLEDASFNFLQVGAARPRDEGRKAPNPEGVGSTVGVGGGDDDMARIDAFHALLDPQDVLVLEPNEVYRHQRHGEIPPAKDEAASVEVIVHPM